MTSYTLKPYTELPNEYQMIKKTPNTNNARIGLQYGLTDLDLQSLNTNINDLDRREWEFVEHSPENLKRLTPDTKTGNSQSWKIIVVILKENGCMKGALRGDDGTIMLMTSLSPESQLNYDRRLIKSNDTEWKICWAKMIAPLFFWREIQYRI